MVGASGFGLFDMLLLLVFVDKHIHFVDFVEAEHIRVQVIPQLLGLSLSLILRLDCSIFGYLILWDHKAVLELNNDTGFAKRFGIF